MKRLTAFISRWRGPRQTAGDRETVVVEARSRRKLWLGVAAGVLAVIVATVLALTTLDEPPPPEPAVPPGQLAREMEAEGAAAGGGAVTIDQATAERLGLQTYVVERRSLERRVQTTGRVTPDERRVTQVHTKVEGWIEETFVGFEGQQVRRGQPLFTIYSPELVATAQEFLIAVRARRGFEQSEFDVVRGTGDELVRAARQRLRLFDLTPAQIAEIERTGKVPKNMTVYASRPGVVTARKAFPGTRVTPDMDLYTLSDLSTIWVEADVFESDLASVRVGTPAEIALPSGETRGARVSFVNPLVAPETRTARVRLELPNPGLELLPGTFVTVTFAAAGTIAVVVARDAVLDTGARRLVLVEEGAGRYVLREIRTGEADAEAIVVLSGLVEGERVARNVQFLVDSETPLRQAVDRFAVTAPPAAGAEGAGGAGSMPGMPGMPGMSGQP